MKTKQTEPPLVSFPARPVNGGRLENAQPKVGPWVYQPKIDDWRAIVHTPTKRIWNRHGKPMSLEQELWPVLSILHCTPFEWLDVGVMERRNQLLRGSIVIFDYIPSVDDDKLTGRSLAHCERRAQLEHDFAILPSADVLHLFNPSELHNRVFLINEFRIPSEHGLGGANLCTMAHAATFDLWRLLQTINQELATDNHGAPRRFYEGIVAKRTDKPYPVQLLSPEKETPWMIKHRFDQ
jgi:hypothetical protein